MKRTLFRAAAFGAAISVAFLMNGCGQEYADGAHRFADQSDQVLDGTRVALGGWTQKRMLRDGWLIAPREPEPRVYCYSTLGGVDCHADAVPGQNERLTVPPPAAPGKAGAAPRALP